MHPWPMASRDRGGMSIIKSTLLALIVSSFFIVSGCSQQEESPVILDTAHENHAVVYENPKAGIRVYETPDWVVGTEVVEPLNVTFHYYPTLGNQQLKAIITVISNESTFNEIKQEFLTGAGEVSIIHESDNHLAYKSERKESIRTDIYLQLDGLHTKIITFMMPLEDYEENQEQMEAFINNIEFY